MNKRTAPEGFTVSVPDFLTVGDNVLKNGFHRPVRAAAMKKIGHDNGVNTRRIRNQLCLHVFDPIAVALTLFTDDVFHIFLSDNILSLFRPVPDYILVEKFQKLVKIAVIKAEHRLYRIAFIFASHAPSPHHDYSRRSAAVQWSKTNSNGKGQSVRKRSYFLISSQNEHR